MKRAYLYLLICENAEEDRLPSAKITTIDGESYYLQPMPVEGTKPQILGEIYEAVRTIIDYHDNNGQLDIEQ